jgi:hypothetical protein
MLCSYRTQGRGSDALAFLTRTTTESNPMIQADRVLSTPPTNTPVDTTRRRFLTVAAIGSMVGAGSLAFAAAAPNDLPKAVTVPPAVAIAEHDPVFGLIDAHRKADRDHEAALDDQDRLERIGDDAAADIASEASCHAAFKAFDVLLAAAATTLPGIVAKLAYLQDIANRDAWMFTDRPDAAIHLLEGFAASIANVWRVQS